MRSFILVAAIALAACTSIAESTRLSTGIEARQFNSAASSYMVRPTFVSLLTMSDGLEVLAIEMDQIGPSRDAMGITVFHQFRMLPDQVDQYVALLDQYDRWRETAIERGDAITRELGRAPGWHGDLKFEFHSGNAESHFLLISFCSVGTCLDNEALAFDAISVDRLRTTLRRWQAGELEALDIGAIYN